ncbi:hypothetical protein [Haliangium sp.]
MHTYAQTPSYAAHKSSKHSLQHGGSGCLPAANARWPGTRTLSLKSAGSG